MIAYVKGKVIEKTTNSVVVDVTGVGYEIFVTSRDAEAATIDDERKFYTYHAVKENSEELYGFSTLAGKRLFELLITVQGIGPKAALAILSLDDVEAVRNAIATANVAFISKASGVGKKSAERVTVDLRDKVGKPSYIAPNNAATITPSTAPLVGDEALDALMALGFNLADATMFLIDVPSDLPTSERVKLALKKR
ncbi:MAG: Holliday junction branch migration protein RuvA [Candidatus Saccharibacteria bacterium]|nr:Holliday junction branch migration protein RuvA [Candidatus Saccharibacteria bacterium]